MARANVHKKSVVMTIPHQVWCGSNGLHSMTTAAPAQIIRLHITPDSDCPTKRLELHFVFCAVLDANKGTLAAVRAPRRRWLQHLDKLVVVVVVVGVVVVVIARARICAVIGSSGKG